MTNTKDIIIKLKEVRAEKGLSFTDITTLMAKNKDSLSRSTLSRLFAEGSEDENFDYEYTIRPVAKALLDIETIDETDGLDVQALKEIIKLKHEKIRELEDALNKEKIKYHEKIDTEREKFQRSLDFLKEQVALKDKRMDLLLNSVAKKDETLQALLEKILLLVGKEA